MSFIYPHEYPPTTTYATWAYTYTPSAEQLAAAYERGYEAGAKAERKRRKAKRKGKSA